MEPSGNDDNPALDPELLNQMSGADADAARAEEAWEEFYRRHFDYLLNVCRNVFSRQIGEVRVPEVVQDVFVKAFRRASTFQPGNSESAEENRWHVRAWLGSILKNTVSDLYRQEPQEVFTEDIELFPDPDSDSDFSQSGGASDEDPPMGPLEKAFLGLEERERDVLRETMLWHTPGARQQRMPTAALQELATRLNTTPANIRQIRSRAIAKLKRAMGEKL
jgi:RNA polymerase sigma factor (sigma-70 family)